MNLNSSYHEKNIEENTEKRLEDVHETWGRRRREGREVQVAEAEAHETTCLGGWHENLCQTLVCPVQLILTCFTNISLY